MASSGGHPRAANKARHAGCARLCCGLAARHAEAANNLATKVCAMKRPKKVVRISQETAARRVDSMAKLIEQNVSSAMYIECALEAANRLIGENESNVTNGIGCYVDGVRQSLLLTLAITLARLFDEGTQSRHVNTRDVASIPLLARLLGQKRCRTVLLDRARLWTVGISC